MADRQIYLVDTNVWLERLLDQEHSLDVEEFLDLVPTHQLHITDFAFHSIGVILYRTKLPNKFVEFTQDVIIEGGVEIVHLEATDMEDVVRCIEDEGLDFDDAYQYITARNIAAEIVSFDLSFDRTKRGRKTPTEVVARVKRLQQAASRDEGR